MKNILLILSTFFINCMNSHQIINIPEIKYIEIEYQTKTNYAKETLKGYYFIYETNFALSESILPDSVVNIGRNKYEIFYQQKKKVSNFGIMQN